MREIPVTGGQVTLGALLKLAGIVQTGGEAKLLLETADVAVNGEPDRRRGRKLRTGDVVSVDDAEPLRVTERGDAATISSDAP